jgi:hypothetical protein
MSKSRREQINKVWTNLFKKLSEAQANREAKAYQKHLDDAPVELSFAVSLEDLHKANQLGISLTEYYQNYEKYGL